LKVAGCGLAGLTAGLTALSRGLEVEIYEQKPNIDPFCAGGIAISRLESLGISFIPQKAILAEIKRVIIRSKSVKAKIQSREPIGYVLDRKKFDGMFLREFEKRGGKVNFGVRLRRGFDVDARGIHGCIHQLNRWDIHVCVQDEIEFKDWPQDTIEIYFSSEVPLGYAWVFPAGGVIRVGLGMPFAIAKRQNLKATFRKVFRRFQAPQGTLKAKLLPTSRIPAKVLELRVGDALPATNPVTGAGIYTAIQTGYYVALSIHTSLRHLEEIQPPRRAYGIAVEIYNRLLWRLRPENWMLYRIKRMLYTFTDRDLDKLVSSMKILKPTMSVSKAMIKAILISFFLNPNWFFRPLLRRRSLNSW